jgi:ribose 5-phosphate isomerase B
MPSAEELSALVRRALGRALAEQGLAPGPRMSGVHVEVRRAEDPARPEARAPGARPPLRVAVGADHGGFQLKGDVLVWLRELGHRPLDLGTHGESPVDYPDFAAAVARAVAEGRADLGVAIDGAGIGSAMAANKIPGVRAANCADAAQAKNAREHNFANVLTLGAKAISPSKALEVLRMFITTSFGEERHARRVAKLAELDRRRGAEPASRT